jgi:hypothetical protein
MELRAMKKLLTILIFGTVVAVLACASCNTTRWGGSYGYVQIEHELTFLDPSGDPIEGVELRVEDQRGNEFFCFPVTDYLPAQTPKSDKDGVIRFHHVSTGVEWDNYGRLLFGFVRVQTTRSPIYVCRFVRGGKEVHRVRYDDLPDWDWPGRIWEEVPKVKRRWNWSVMIPNEIRYKPDDTLESHYSRLRVFFHDEGDERPNREVAVAYRNAMKLLFKLEEQRGDQQELVEEIEFPVIRRTITVALPGDAR